MTEKTFRDRRGISEILGFILTFAIIIGAVSFVYLAGFASLADLRTGEQVNSDGRTMRGVAEAFEDIHQDEAPERSIEIDLNQGSISRTESSVEFQVTYDSGSGPTTRTIPLDVGAFRLEPADSETEFVYENGALFRLQNQGSLLRSRPSFTCTDTAAHVSVVTVRGDIDVSTSESVEVSASHRTSRLRYPKPGTDQSPEAASSITVDFSGSANTDAWEQFFVREYGPDSWAQIGDTPQFECTGVKRVYIRETVVNVTRVS